MLYGLYLVCFQQVYAQLPAVYLQHPFWGDVSPFSRCEAAFSKTQSQPDPFWESSEQSRAQFDQDLTCHLATPDTAAFRLTILEV